jgi:hypothetical protein
MPGTSVIFKDEQVPEGPPPEDPPADWAAPRHGIPEIAFCSEKARLVFDFLNSIRNVTSLQKQQTQAVIEDDPDFARFDLLIHIALETKDAAKYALMSHMESHGC